jgi:hypothetical protein
VPVIAVVGSVGGGVRACDDCAWDVDVDEESRGSWYDARASRIAWSPVPRAGELGHCGVDGWTPPNGEGRGAPAESGGTWSQPCERISAAVCLLDRFAGGDDTVASGCCDAPCVGVMAVGGGGGGGARLEEEE